MALKYKRILLKLSGEALCGAVGGFGLDPKTVEAISARAGRGAKASASSWRS